MRPDFLIIGSPKCGTTTLWHALSRHPQVFMTRQKEPGFFSEHYGRGWDWYMSLFEGSQHAVAAGEATPAYSAYGYGEEVADRIARHLPAVKLIYMLRHPLRKIESEWLQARKQSRRNVSWNFNDSVRRDRFVIGSVNYLDKLRLYEQRFGRERIHVIFLEELEADWSGGLVRCSRFLGVDETAACTIRLEAQNVASRQRVDTTASRWLRRSSAVRRAAATLPAPLTRAAAALIKRSVSGRPVWDPVVRSMAIDRIREQVEGALKWCDKPVDYWGWDEPDAQAARDAA